MIADAIRFFLSHLKLLSSENVPSMTIYDNWICGQSGHLFIIRDFQKLDENANIGIRGYERPGIYPHWGNILLPDFFDFT